MSFKLSIVAPDQTVFEDTVASVTVPGVEGYMGLLSFHEPVIAALQHGIIECRLESGETQNIAITGGFMEASDNKVIILADNAVHATEVDIALTEKELEEARKALRGEQSSVTSEEAEEVMRRAMVRIRAARKAGSN